MTLSRLKTLMPLLVVAAGLVASIVMNFIQKANTDAQLEFIVKNMNEAVIPSIQQSLEELKDDVGALKEDNSFWKGFFQIGKYTRKGEKIATDGPTVEERMSENGGVVVDMGAAKFHYVQPDKPRKMRAPIQKLSMEPMMFTVDNPRGK